MQVLFYIIASVIAAACILLNVFILMQKKRSAGLSGTMAGMGASGQTYWDKNKGRSLEGQLEMWSKILGAVFMVLCLILSFIR